MENYLETINRYQKEIILLNKIIELLHWDKETHLPKKGIDTRAEKIAYLSRLAHQKITSSELWTALQNIKHDSLNADEKIMMQKLTRDVSKAKKIPEHFVEELSRTTAKATSSWLEAREKKDFSVFQPALEKIVELKKQQAKYLGLPGHPYNSLLDEFEEGMTEEELKPKFEELKKGLKSLLDKIKDSEKYKKQKLVLTKKEFPREIQMQLAADVIKRIGLEEEFSRIDFSEHPFSSGIGVNDVRITTNIREDPLFSFGSTIHEAGHALYFLGYPKEHFYNVLGAEPSVGIHESQSRFWENMIGKSRPFWNFYFPIFKEKFKLDGSLEQWYEEMNFVHPNLIRIESDEVHYNLHIILRFEVELGLLDGTISVKELPKIWNKKIEESFGIIPKNDKEGVLQDVHWSNGYFGYFPTYALGTIYSAQIYNALKEDLPDIEMDIEKGDFKRIGKWLHDNIHQYGRKLLAEDLIKKVCGKGLNVKEYMEYLNKKYGEIYDF